MTSGRERERPNWNTRRTSVAVLIIVLTCAAFWQVGSHEFVMYDDVQYVTANPRVQQGLTLDNVRWALTAIDASNWHPLTWYSHMLDCQLFGLAAGWHHVTSLLLHVVSAVLLFVVLQEMTSALWPSAFVAALFAIHPLHVESVAYVAERKDVLSGVFWMLSLWAYERYVRAPSLGRYLRVVVCFALGLASKPMIVTLPCVLVLLDVWPLRRLTAASLRPVLLEKVPLFAMAAGASVLTVVAQYTGGSVAVLEEKPIATRAANMVLAYVTYLRRTFWPSDLACFYPYPRSFVAWQVVLAAIALLAMCGVALTCVRRHPYVTVGWFWFLGTLFPVIGMTQVGEQAMADRFTYLPLIGLFIVITWGADELFGRTRAGRTALAAAAGLALALLLIRTRIEVAYWRDSTALFERALAVTTDNHVAHNNLGLVLRQRGQSAEAMAQFAAALEASPRNATARNHLGLTQRDLGRDVEAIASFRESLRLAPDLAPAHFNLGESLLRAGQVEAAAAELRETLRLNPEHPNAHLQLGAALRELGGAADAEREERAALALRPDWPEAHAYLADALAELGKLDEAIEHYGEALRLAPGGADVHYNFGNALARKGQIDAAATQYRQAIALAPDHAEAHNNLGRALVVQGNADEAIAHYSEALRLAPNLAAAYYNRAKALQQQGEAERARLDFARARDLDPRLR